MDSTTTNRDHPAAETAPAHGPATVRRAAKLFALYVLVQVWVLIVVEVLSDFGLRVPWIISFLTHQIIGWSIVLYLAVRGSGTTWRENFPLQPVSTRLMLPVIVLCAGLSILLIQLASLIPQPDFVRRMSEMYLGSPWYLLVASGVIVAPVCEEAFHRGWLLAGLRMRYSTRKAIIVSSIAFALFHLNPWQAVIAFPTGVLFAWLVVRTGSLWPSILGHAVTNATATVVNEVLQAMGHDDDRIEQITYLPPALLLAGGLLAIVGCLSLARGRSLDSVSVR